MRIYRKTMRAAKNFLISFCAKICRNMTNIRFEIGNCEYLTIYACKILAKRKWKNGKKYYTNAKFCAILLT